MRKRICAALIALYLGFALGMLLMLPMLRM